ncbi:hypothetical protein NST62_01110 [Ureibacillus sp. FSL K6-8385]|uniref:hypothetical protein n=1 Tax=Ureibacillus TaxID=160795 RepID=UPI002E25116F|nr:hypothetical protein [Ureibacillus terrenus]
MPEWKGQAPEWGVYLLKKMDYVPSMKYIRPRGAPSAQAESPSRPVRPSSTKKERMAYVRSLDLLGF